MLPQRIQRSPPPRSMSSCSCRMTVKDEDTHGDHHCLCAGAKRPKRRCSLPTPTLRNRGRAVRVTVHRSAEVDERSPPPTAACPRSARRARRRSLQGAGRDGSTMMRGWSPGPRRPQQQQQPPARAVNPEVAAERLRPFPHDQEPEMTVRRRDCAGGARIIYTDGQPRR